MRMISGITLLSIKVSPSSISYSPRGLIITSSGIRKSKILLIDLFITYRTNIINHSAHTNYQLSNRH